MGFTSRPIPNLDGQNYGVVIEALAEKIEKLNARIAELEANDQAQMAEIMRLRKNEYQKTNAVGTDQLERLAFENRNKVSYGKASNSWDPNAPHPGNNF